MLGWEFPPYNIGGLGTACYGLTKELSKKGVKIVFVIPKSPVEPSSDFITIINAAVNYDHLYKFVKVKSRLIPYHESYSYRGVVFKKERNKCAKVYGEELFKEVEIYAKRVLEIAKWFDFDLIHVHDWMTYPAGINLKKKFKKKLIAHIHATEFDRSGGNPNPRVYEIEKQGFQYADRIIAVSNYTKNMVVTKYNIDPSKIEVVHNGVLFENISKDYDVKVFPDEKVVLFLGRITLQKGPDYFIEAAKVVSDMLPRVKFIITGSGDMLPWLVHRAAELGIADKVIFTGFLRGKELDMVYKMADVYVMPSVSEPFGITPLEALIRGTPVIISKQSGVSEVLNHCLKVDFWDIRKLANHIIAVLKYKELRNELKHHGYLEVMNINWEKAAEKVLNIYYDVLSGG